ncbi:hypothetical protein SKAU_G00165410 [Synaphobranchus kaupii]|uniref:TFIIS N-terminal domain-containing protein n=1 Tax=Synaphobranchus kaupii TaxID=118154 RepID=A0A9Q1IZA5_SYNKA|nr:hypothetical protein SKAU_G00165410 [Synaphobranchus kaupii]
MAAADVLKRVLQLKRQLKESPDSKTILKTLKRLQELDITLNVLADTGIGKAVNAFRKHANAGEVAKSLVMQWKKLVPKESTSPVQEESGGEDEWHKDQLEVSENKCVDGKNLESTSPDNECKPVGSHKRIKVPFSHESKGGSSHLRLKNTTKKDKNKVSSPKSSLPSVERPNSDSEFRENGKRGMCEITNGQETKSSLKDKKSSRSKETLLESNKKEESSDRKKGLNGDVKKLYAEERKVKKSSGSAKETRPSEDEFAKPTMSFESYLSYDVKAPKRKKKPCDGQKTAKKLKMTAAREESWGKASVDNNITEQPKHRLEDSPKKSFQRDP